MFVPDVALDRMANPLSGFRAASVRSRGWWLIAAAVIVVAFLLAMPTVVTTHRATDFVWFLLGAVPAPVRLLADSKDFPKIARIDCGASTASDGTWPAYACAGCGPFLSGAKLFLAIRFSFAGSPVHLKGPT